MKTIRILLFIIVIPVLSCSRQLLSFFFDGVNAAEKENIVLAQASVESVDSLQTTDSSRVDLYQSIHPDYKSRLCGKCHDATKSNRLSQQHAELCYTCHKQFAGQYTVLHGPVAAGMCTACHLPHRSKYLSLLRQPIREICQHCHVPGDVNKNAAHEKISATPCLDCHDPHGGVTIQLLNNR
ncbi:hypothetical protein JW960_04230 [candidate division KSB1 bacterium]|nr:hypothetical protein [candidate division KSB1 bacterium]